MRHKPNQRSQFTRVPSLSPVCSTCPPAFPPSLQNPWWALTSPFGRSCHPLHRNKCQNVKFFRCCSLSTLSILLPKDRICRWLSTVVVVASLKSKYSTARYFSPAEFSISHFNIFVLLKVRAVCVVHSPSFRDSWVSRNCQARSFLRRDAPPASSTPVWLPALKENVTEYSIKESCLANRIALASRCVNLGVLRLAHGNVCRLLCRGEPRRQAPFEAR